ncbi:MAG: bifunctional transaldolase/phosoglucose isomerase [Myxococcales bacterium]|nr:bifunctional transaldolase/phosoglucose isomerase [Myxococcales bacterium]
MNRIRALREHGQSVWYDYIQRDMIWTGALHRMVEEDGLAGVTSNPSIFEKAIGGSAAYAPAVKAVVAEGASAGEIFDALAVTDIQLACDVLRPVYDASGGKDGFVSLEVSPYLAHDTLGTVEEAHRLWEEVGRENLMIKVPGTAAGVPAVEQLISDGVNVNVTLLFSVERYIEVAKAYIVGLERFAAAGGDPAGVASVASFFVSRIDNKVDAAVQARLQNASGDDKARLEGLLGKVAIANAKLAYRAYQELTAEPRWKALVKQGAHPQRLLWASTSTKNPAYKDTLYVEELVGPDTVNTVPAATYTAFQEHGEVKATLADDLDGAKAIMATLASFDISLARITEDLEHDGVDQFARAFDTLMVTVEDRRVGLLGDRLSQMSETLGAYQGDVDGALKGLTESGFVRRMWERDGTLFGEGEAAEHAASFMGWLDITDSMLENVHHLIQLQEDLEDEEVEQVVLMGMGGSSLAPDVFARTFGQLDGSPELLVLDSTVPAQVKAIEHEVEQSQNTVFITASKSGTTTEPLCFDAYFWDQVQDGDHFIAITDPGSKLEEESLERGIRGVYNGDPEVGGRYSALSPFGLVPAAAMGLDPVDLLERADLMIASCEASVPPARNAGVRLGAVIGTLAEKGRDKLTFVMSPAIASLGGWIEQLVAESTGKHGKGIVPVDGEALGAPEVYGADRVFVAIELDGDAIADEGKLAALAAAGHPVVRIRIGDRRDLVQEMFRWEVATATAGHIMGINPFDQPNVQESKDYTKRLLGEAKDGKLPSIEGEVKLFEEGGITVYTDTANAAALGEAKTLTDALKAHINRAGAGDYVAFNAYVEMTDAHGAALQRLRQRVRDGHQVATTVGFGPRFLHSTGQLHKGGANNGVFLQITCDDAEALPVPGQGFGFSLLKQAQEAGDFMALSSRGRRLLRVHLKDVEAGLAALAQAIGA